jgi:hypothetical protein
MLCVKEKDEKLLTGRKGDGTPAFIKRIEYDVVPLVREIHN